MLCFVSLVVRALSLGELRCTTSCLQAVLLSFLHAGISGEEACLLDSRTVLSICLAKGTCDTMTDSACLTGKSAAANGYDNIVFVCNTEKFKGADER